jgi:Tfp pilus assembly protein PilF
MERFVNLDFDGALESLQSAEKADPQNVAVQVRFIAIYAVKRDNAAAKIHYEKLKEIDPATAADVLANDVPEALRSYLED